MPKLALPFVKYKWKIPFTLVFVLVFTTISSAQFREKYRGTDENNAIKGMSFISPSTGFVAFEKFIGFTTDSGSSYTRRYMDYSNTDYSGNRVNLTFGFYPQGLKAFSKDSLFLYGHFGTEPTILFSSNGGLFWKVMYHRPYNMYAPVYNDGVTDLEFIGNSNTAYAVHHEGIIRTTNRGQSWSVVLNTPNQQLRKLSFVSSNVGYAVGKDKMYKTVDGGASWTLVDLPANPEAGELSHVQFFSASNGYISGNGKFYRTVDGGAGWQQMNDETINAIGGSDMFFVNDSTGFFTTEQGYNIFKTTDYGVSWELCKKSTDYQYLGYGLNALYFLNGQIGWVGGGREFLLITTNGALQTIPKATFKTDTTGVASTGLVKLFNQSKTKYSSKWYVNGVFVSSDYNSSYHHENNSPVDTIQLVVSNGVDADTAVLWQYFNIPPPPPVPTINSFSPSSEKTGGVVTINGINFTGATSVQFGGEPASSFTVTSNTTIIAKVGSGATGSISVTTPFGVATKEGFTFRPPPSVSSFSPTSGDVGTLVTIFGSNFTGTLSVRFGGVEAASFTVVSPTTIKAVVGSGASGRVSVTSADGIGALDGFSFSASPPVITGFAPLSGVPGTVVTLTGHNFSTVAAENTVYFGAVKASVLATDSTYLKVIVPLGATYDYISVTASNLTAFSTMPFLISFEGGASIDQHSFAEKKDFVTGYYPYELSLVDIDKDGAVDISASNFNEPTIGVLKNKLANSGLDFPPYTNFKVGAYLRRSSYGDFDGDGLKDLVLCNYFNHTLTISKNTSVPGAISFDSGKIYATQPYPWEAAIADLDGDGRPDIVVGIEGNGSDLTFTFSIYRNTTTGGETSFAPRVDFQSAGVPYSPIIADMDGDGKPDIIFNKGRGRTITIFRNTSSIGNIAFAPYQTFGDYINGGEYTIGDLDGDGKLDVVLIGYVTQLGSIMRNTSTPGRLSFDDVIHFQGNDGMSKVAIGDLNGDAKPDIVVSSQAANAVSVYENMSSPGSIALKSKIDFATGSVPSSSLGIGDLDGDGRPEIIVGNSNSQTISILRNQVAGQLKIAVCENGATKVSTDIQGANFQWQINNGAGWLDLTDDSTRSGSLSSALQLQKIPMSWNAYKLRCKVDTLYSSVFTLLVNSLVIPSVNIQASSTSVCTGSEIEFSATSTNAGVSPKYQWQVNGINTGEDSATFTIASLKDNDRVSVILTSSEQCVMPATVKSNVITITVTNGVTPSVTITASDSSVCYGMPITFTATSAGSGTSPTYQWKVNGNSVGTNSRQYTTNALNNNDQVSVSLTSSIQCASPAVVHSNSIAVSISPVPVANAGLDRVVCEGNSITIGMLAAVGHIYSWTSNPAGFISSVANPIVNPTATTAYFLEVNDGGACTGKDTVTITVPPLIAVNAGPDRTLCSGSISGVGLGLTTQIPGYTFAWSPGTGLTDSTKANPGALPGATTTYILTATSPDGCLSRDTVVVTVTQTLPTPIISSTDATTVCPGGSVVLKSSYTTGNQWYKDSLTLTGATDQYYPATQAGRYSVRAVAGGCTSDLSAPLSVIVKSPIQPPSISANGPTTFCEGYEVTLHSSVASGNQWYKDGIVLIGATSPTLLVNRSGSYTCRTIDSLCNSVPSNALVVTVNPIPATPLISRSGNIFSSSVTTGNQWYLDSIQIPGAIDPIYAPIMTGTYTVRVTSNACQSAFSNAIDYIASPVYPSTLDSSIFIGPNPVSDQLMIRYNGSPTQLVLTLLDSWGRELQRISFFTSYALDMRGYKAGPYIILVMNPTTGEQIKRVIIKN